MLSIEDKNKLIAEWNGFQQIDNTSILTDDKTEVWLKNKNGNIVQGVPKYHTSWALLMPVVEKIEDEMVGVIIRTWSCEISYRNGGAVIAYVEAKPKIIAVHSAVIQFIQYHNSYINK